MIKKILFLFLFTHVGFYVKSQITFQYIYGDVMRDEAKSVARSGNGYIMIGSSTDPGIDSSKIIFEKFDSIGNFILSSVLFIDNAKNDFGNNTKATPDDGLIICGTTYASNIDPVSSDAFLIHTDQFGNTDWANVYGGLAGSDEGYTVDLCLGGGYYVTGTTGTGPGNSGGYVMKTDAAGTPVWHRTNTILNKSRFNRGCTTLDGGFVATGSTLYAGSKDLFVAKYDSTGTIKWSKRSSAAGDQAGNSVFGTADGGCVIAGTNSANGSVNSTDLLVVKLDSLGATVWSKTYNFLFEDVATDIIELANGHLILSCYVNSTDNIAPVRSICFLELTASGIPVTASYYGSNTLDKFSNSVLQATDGGFVLAGITYEYDVKGDAVLIKTDPSGGTHACSIAPVSFIATDLLLADSSGSSTTSVFPDYSSIAFQQESYSTSFSPICFEQFVSENNPVSAVNLFPNPVNEELTVQIDVMQNFETLRVHDVLGRTVISEQIHAGETSVLLHAGPLKPGIYQVELRGNNALVVRKFIKIN